MEAQKRLPAGELKDLTVYEVSIVDRPANKRPFLIAKSDNEPSVAEAKVFWPLDMARET
jgi:hypothetical protein